MWDDINEVRIKLGKTDNPKLVVILIHTNYLRYKRRFLISIRHKIPITKWVFLQVLDLLP